MDSRSYRLFAIWVICNLEQRINKLQKQLGETLDEHARLLWELSGGSNSPPSAARRACRYMGDGSGP